MILAPPSERRPGADAPPPPAPLATPLALGAWGPAYVTRENFENMMQFGGFWCIFDQIVS